MPNLARAAGAEASPGDTMALRRYMQARRRDSQRDRLGGRANRSWPQLGFCLRGLPSPSPRSSSRRCLETSCSTCRRHPRCPTSRRVPTACRCAPAPAAARSADTSPSSGGAACHQAVVCKAAMATKLALCDPGWHLGLLLARLHVVPLPLSCSAHVLPLCIFTCPRRAHPPLLIQRRGARSHCG